MKRRLLLFVCLVMQLAIFANPVEIDLSSGSYTNTFTQGEAYILSGGTGEETWTVNTEWYVAPDFFRYSKSDDKGYYVFRATSGVYRLTADATNKSILVDKIWNDSDEGDEHWKYKEGYNPSNKQGAIWVTGANGSIGLPSYSDTDVNAWSHVYCVPKMGDNIFEWTVTVGQELNKDKVNFKFRGTPYDWGKEFNGSEGSTYRITTESEVFGIGTGSGEGGNGHDDGNIYLKSEQTLTKGDTYKFKLDCTDAYNIVLTAQKLKLTSSTLTSAKGTTVYQHINVPLTATFYDEDGEQIANSELTSITYTIVSGVGSIDENGVFTSAETGTAVVKVTGVLGGITVEATLTLTVQKIPESTDPTKPGADVHAPYSDSYIKRLYFLDGNVWKDGDNATKHTFDDDSHNHFAIFNNFKHYVTVDMGGNLDVTGYTHLHVDVMQLTGDTNKNLYINPQAGANNPADTRDDNTKLACEKGVWKSFDIDLSKTPFTDITSYKQIAFLSENGSTADESFAIDNVYFWRDQPADPVTVDTDKKGLNWNSDKGTTCYFDRIIWERCNSTTTKKGLDGFAKAHDGDNLTYHTITPEELVSPNQHAQLLLMLTKPIKVSDLELIWANGFPKEYKVYAFEQFPLVDDAVPAELLEEESGNLLFEVDRILTTDPSFETRSNLQNEVEHLSQYILIDMTERGEASTFGYYLAEAHVGAYDATYLTPDHLGIPDYKILTDVDQTLEVTVRNKRNAILEGETYRQGSVTTTLTSPQLKKRNNQETVLYATSPAEYTIKIDGELSDGTPLNQGTGTITADRNWGKSLVQQVYDKYEGNTAKLNEMFQASRTEGSYSPYMVGDGKEAAQNIYSRWSSFNNYDPYEIPWDGTEAAANRRKEWNKNQYLLINLDKVYELTNIELIWERAYSPEYTVFGFETEDLPTGELNQDYNTFCTNYASHLLYTGTNSAANISMYPLHDEHTSLNTGTGAITRDNRTQYLVIKMNEPAQQSGDYFGFSLWEVYAEGADLTITDNVSRLEAPNISVKARHEGVQNITAKGTYSDENIEEEKWHPVTFSTEEDGYAIFADHHTDTETGTTLERFYMYKQDESFNVTDANSLPSEIPAQYLVAIITDNNNGTYGIVAGNNGYGQKNGEYKTDDQTYKSFTIKMHSTNTKTSTEHPNGQDIEGTFELVIYKDVMQLLDGTSTDKRQVYDDGYYSETVLRDNITAETVTIDLRNVDFTYDNNGDAVNSSTKPIPAPHTVKKGEVQLNPNTIYYTDETNLVAEGNLAVKQGSIWSVAMLRIFDGWNWEPIDNEGGMIATKASFYTSIPANHYSFIALPFAPDISYFSGKQVKLYKPTAFRPDRNAVKIEEVSNFSSDLIGHPLVIYTEDANNYRENGYAVVFKSSGTETSVNYFPGQWENNGATIIPSYTKQNLEASDASFDYYLYSIKNDQFLQVGSSELAEDQWNGNENSSDAQPHLSASQVMPFYAYMKVPAQASPAPAFTFTLIDDTETTGIDAAEAETDGTVKVYDVQGRYVSDSSRNLTPGMYIIKRADGSTRKVYIKK